MSNRPTFSLHSSVFNVAKAGFDWAEALTSWLTFMREGDQLVLAANTSEDDTPTLLRDWLKRWHEQHVGSGIRTDVIDIAIPYTEADFDGRGKAAALDACTEPYAILLDLDERIPPSMRRRWDALATELERTPQLDGWLIPSIDLHGDEDHYRCGEGGPSSKWYLHRRLPHITRGVVKWARREDGSIDKTRSDTCEAVNRETGDLIRAAPILNPAFPHWLAIPQMEGGEIPFVYHLGSLNLEQRVKQSAFWRPHWDNRDKHSAEPEVTLEQLAAIPRYRHHLPSWRETR